MPGIKFKCTQCNQSIEAPGEMAGTNAECPGCGIAIIVPADSNWKNHPATEKQIEHAKELGIPLHEGMSKGELSVLIDVAHSVREKCNLSMSKNINEIFDEMITPEIVVEIFERRKQAVVLLSFPLSEMKKETKNINVQYSDSIKKKDAAALMMLVSLNFKD